MLFFNLIQGGEGTQREINLLTFDKKNFKGDEIGSFNHGYKTEFILWVNLIRTPTVKELYRQQQKINCQNSFLFIGSES